MCGAISTLCSTEGCDNWVRYEVICHKCKANFEHPTGV